MSSQSNSRQVSVDYLIVGGGVQGLWTLKEILSLPKRHSVMLASRGPLGNGTSPPRVSVALPNFPNPLQVSPSTGTTLSLQPLESRRYRGTNLTRLWNR
jgi:hypothetical protein